MKIFLPLKSVSLFLVMYRKNNSTQESRWAQKISIWVYIKIGKKKKKSFKCSSAGWFPTEIRIKFKIFLMTFPGLALLSSLTLLCPYHTLATGLLLVPQRHAVPSTTGTLHIFSRFVFVFVFLNYFILEYIWLTTLC